jgi:predicted metal-binding membrane protein
MASTTPAVPPRRPWPRLTTPLERGQLAVLLALVALTAGAWFLTIYQAQTMDMPMGVVVRGAMPDPNAPAVMDDMGGMAMDDAGDMAATGMAGAGWSIAALAAFVVAWAVMMAAMMFPAAAPMLLLYRTIATQRGASGQAFVPTWVFAAGYLLVWTVVGALTWVLVQALSDRAGQFETADRATWAPLALGGVLIVAGLYQLTPLKQGGALRMGIVHGAYCLGCCWALFAVLVAAGVMSLAWMLLLTLVVFAEKVLPGGQRTSQVVGVAFLILGVVVAGGVLRFPWMA